MKKVKVLMLGLASMLLLQACVKDDATKDQEKAKESLQKIEQYLATNGINAQKSPDGFYYVIKPGGVSPRKPENLGDQLTVHYIGSLLNGEIFNRSETNKPLRFAYKDGTVIPGFNNGVGLMQKGDTADLYLPSDLAFGNRALANVPAYSPVWFHVVLEEVLTEDESLKKYIDTKKLTNVNSTPITRIPFETVQQDGNKKVDSLYHVITKVGDGNPMDRTKINKVTVNYRGLYVDGTEFDKGASTPFELKDGAVIKGFLEGMLRMTTGEKAIFLIPSGLGYGASGSNTGKIPPYTPLIFEVELLKIE